MKNRIKALLNVRSKKGQKGLSLLEYAMGAAVLITVVWAAMNTLGGNMRDLLNAIGGFAGRTATNVNGIP